MQYGSHNTKQIIKEQFEFSQWCFTMGRSRGDTILVKEHKKVCLSTNV